MQAKLAATDFHPVRASGALHSQSARGRHQPLRKEAGYTEWVRFFGRRLLPIPVSQKFHFQFFSVQPIISATARMTMIAMTNLPANSATARNVLMARSCLNQRT